MTNHSIDPITCNFAAISKLHRLKQYQLIDRKSWSMKLIQSPLYEFVQKFSIFSISINKTLRVEKQDLYTIITYTPSSPRESHHNPRDIFHGSLTDEQENDACTIRGRRNWGWSLDSRSLSLSLCVLSAFHPLSSLLPLRPNHYSPIPLIRTTCFE